MLDFNCGHDAVDVNPVEKISLSNVFPDKLYSVPFILRYIVYVNPVKIDNPLKTI